MRLHAAANPNAPTEPDATPVRDTALGLSR